MQTDLYISNIAHVIQLAVAPVFLIAGVGSMLGVLTNRVARIVDRARRLEDQLRAGPAAPLREELGSDLAVLARRARLANWAIGGCAICAALICSVVVLLFVGALGNARVAEAVAVLFILAMTSFLAGLLCFLREIQIATAHLRIGLPAAAGVTVDAATRDQR
ncbi:MAG TPA: DUF2721 domain-containing protein [Solimonas sp.]|nr:DUF2721 domain-containing protein [Solimonas sp.]